METIYLMASFNKMFLMRLGVTKSFLIVGGFFCGGFAWYGCLSRLLGWSRLLRLSELWGHPATPQVGWVWNTTVCACLCGVSWFLTEFGVVLLTVVHACWCSAVDVLVMSIDLTPETLGFGSHGLFDVHVLKFCNVVTALVICSWASWTRIKSIPI